MPKFEEEQQKQKLFQIKTQEEEALTRLLAGKYKVPYVDLGRVPVNSDALATVDEKDARNGRLAIIQKAGRKLQIVVENPELPETKEVLEKIDRMNYTYQLFMASKRGLEKTWETYKGLRERIGVSAGEIDITREGLEKFEAKIKSISDIAPLITESLTKTITDLLEIIIAGSLKVGASDIHIEPQAENVRIRYRLDGVLQDVLAIDRKAFKFLLGRVKLIAGLKLNITERAQDGRYTIKLPDVEIEVRVSVLPGQYGENIVMRVLNPRALNITLDTLGIRSEISEEMAHQLAQPNGMILTTGPTGSGKTTTLYTFLKTIHTPDIKIITLEDPIEYHIPGVEQTQVNPVKNYTFALGLRSVLRQDPDVILVGEIRDFETAETAMHAALTGHLVLSTLHSNDAAGAVPRLLDIGVKPQLIAPALNMAIAQRLLRRLCPHCKKPGKPDGSERAVIAEELNSFPPHSKIKKPDIKLEHVEIYRAGGCDACNMTGYKGRIGIFEIVVIDELFENIILKSPTEQDMRKAAYQQGQITIRQDAILRILEGVTDMEEFKRILG